MEYVNGGKTALQLNQMIKFFSYHTSFGFSWLEMFFLSLFQRGNNRTCICIQFIQVSAPVKTIIFILSNYTRKRSSNTMSIYTMSTWEKGVSKD